MRTLYVGIGVIAILIGLVWTLQGANVIMGSVMSGSSFWLAVGVVLLLVGAGVLVLGARSPGSKKAA
jgi:hypothetical protein